MATQRASIFVLPCIPLMLLLLVMLLLLLIFHFTDAVLTEVKVESLNPTKNYGLRVYAQSAGSYHLAHESELGPTKRRDALSVQVKASELHANYTISLERKSDGHHLSTNLLCFMKPSDVKDPVWFLDEDIVKFSYTDSKSQKPHEFRQSWQPPHQDTVDIQVQIEALKGDDLYKVKVEKRSRSSSQDVHMSELGPTQRQDTINVEMETSDLPSYFYMIWLERKSDGQRFGRNLVHFLKISELENPVWSIEEDFVKFSYKDKKSQKPHEIREPWKPPHPDTVVIQVQIQTLEGGESYEVEVDKRSKSSWKPLHGSEIGPTQREDTVSVEMETSDTPSFDYTIWLTRKSNGQFFEGKLLQFMNPSHVKNPVWCLDGNSITFSYTDTRTQTEHKNAHQWMNPTD